MRFCEFLAEQNSRHSKLRSPNQKSPNIFRASCIANRNFKVACPVLIQKGFKIVEKWFIKKRATLTLLSCSPNFSSASITPYMHAKQANQFFSIINANFANFRKVFRHRQFDDKFP